MTYLYENREILPFSQSYQEQIVFQLQSYPYSIVLARSKKKVFIKSQKYSQL